MRRDRERRNKKGGRKASQGKHRGEPASVTPGRASVRVANTLRVSRGPVTATGLLNIPVCGSLGAGAAWDAGLSMLKPERYRTHPTEGGEKAGVKLNGLGSERELRNVVVWGTVALTVVVLIFF